MSRLLYFFVILLLHSCYSFKLFPVEYRDFKYTGEKRQAYIINPELKKEKNILEQSGIFQLTEDSSVHDCLFVQLQPIRRQLACGQPIIASAFVLGQLPVYFPDRYDYQFTEIRGVDTTARRFELLVATRVWFWDMFTFKKDFKKTAGQSLLASYHKPLLPAESSTALTTGGK